jgi:muramoyltetrapeptide carboxypeptidase LdcA involved in peptidoglycan recycling
MLFSNPLVKPEPLKAGDRVAVVSPSWGGPSVCPERYRAGKMQLEEVFGVEVVEMPRALAPADWLAMNPKARAEDVMQAFSDRSIKAIVASIGGSDAIRLMPHLDLRVIRENPKIFLGYSDTTALHFACLAAGVGSFYGPSIMSGFAENGGMHRYAIDAVRAALFRPEPIGRIPANTEGWTAEQTDWSDAAAQELPRKLRSATPPHMVQGRGCCSGNLIGGCAEILEMLKGTEWWPPHSFWEDVILFYETSENAPSPTFIKYWLRNFAAQGILKRLNGILLARPDPGGDEDYQNKLEQAFIEVLAEEGLQDLPVLSGLDFGHTQPMSTLPYGVRAEIDSETATLTILEAATQFAVAEALKPIYSAHL